MTRTATYTTLLRECSARTADERARNLAASGIIIAADAADALTRGATYETDALAIVRTWCDAHTGICRECNPPVIRPCPHPDVAPRRILILSAAIGFGKSTAAAYAIARLGGRYVAASRLAEMARRITAADADRYELLLTSGLLVVDDLGTAQDPKRERAAIHEIVDHRQGDRPLTIITTNLDEARFHARLDSRTVSRLGAYAVFVQCEGVDQRAARAASPASGRATGAAK
jgi:hypothetical protein